MAIEPTDAVPDSSRGRNDLPAVGYMLLAVLGISMVPLLVDLGNGAASPFLFNAGWRGGVALGCLLFLAAAYWPLFRDRAVLARVARRVFCWSILLAVVGNCEYSLFAWSARFTDISIVTVLYEVWPLFLILLIAWLYRGENRYRKIKCSSLAIMFVAVSGVVTVISGQVGGFSGSSVTNGVLAPTLIGAGLAIAAAMLAPLMAFGFRWASDLAVELGAQFAGDEAGLPLEMFCVVIAFCVSSSGASAVSLGIGLIVGDAISVQSLSLSIVGGALTNAVAGISWRKANFITSNLGINAIAYMVPAASLLWLALFGRIEISSPGHLIVGAAAVIAANLLINFEAEIRWGFKSLIEE